MDRAAIVTEPFTRPFRRLGAEPVVLSLEEWAGVEPRDNLRVALGFRRPELGEREVRFCPELDLVVNGVLDGVEVALEVLVADAELYAEGPGSLGLLTAVHMAWLDRMSR